MERTAFRRRLGVTASDTDVEAVLLGGCEHAAAIIEQRKPLEMTTAPRCSQLRLIPLAVGGTRQTFAPDLKRVVEDLFQELAVGRDDVHGWLLVRG